MDSHDNFHTAYRKHKYHITLTARVSTGSGIWEFSSFSVKKWHAFDLSVLASYSSVVPMLNGTGISEFAINTIKSKFRSSWLWFLKRSGTDTSPGCLNWMAISWCSTFDLSICPTSFKFNLIGSKKPLFGFSLVSIKASLASAPAFSTRITSAWIQEAVAPVECVLNLSIIPQIMDSLLTWHYRYILLNKEKLLNISRQAEKYTQEYCVALLRLHALTGIDTTISSIGLEKMKPLQYMQRFVPVLAR